MTIFNNQIVRPLIKNVGSVKSGWPLTPPGPTSPTPTPSTTITPTPTPTLTSTPCPSALPPSPTPPPPDEFINADTHFDYTTGWSFGTNEWSFSDSLLNGLITDEFTSVDAYLVQRLEYGVWYSLFMQITSLDDLPEFGGRFFVTLEVEGQIPSAIAVITEAGPLSADFRLDDLPFTNWAQPGPFVLKIRGSTTGAAISIDSISLQQSVT